MSTAQILKDARAGMDKAIEAAKRDFAGVRSGRATPNMLDSIKVEAYGTLVPLNQVAAVSAPEPRILLVTPFDKGLAKVIEKSIRESDLGLDPAHNAGVIRVPLPSMNEQRRNELKKVVNKLGEDGKIAVRHARTDARDKVKKLDGVSEDEKKQAEKELQKVHDEAIAKIDGLVKAKEADLMEV